jgi:acyl-coenzyme A thioesterase PaaI-like protein
MDDEALRVGMNRSIPFNALIGVEVLELGSGRGSPGCPGRPGLENHVGTHHATVTYGVGEAASGAAMLSIFGDVIDEIVPLARSAEITYRRPGLGILTAIATVVVLARPEGFGRARTTSVAARSAIPPPQARHDGLTDPTFVGRRTELFKNLASSWRRLAADRAGQTLDRSRDRAGVGWAADG